jgi:translation initiation factor 4E
MSDTEKQQGGEVHPLHTAWTLWFLDPKVDSKSDWNARLQSVKTFATVEDFWSLFNSMIQPTRLPHNGEIYVFREGQEPSYETHPDGGVWSVMIPMEERKFIEEAWLSLVLHTIGETAGKMNDDVIGVAASMKRRMLRISMWTSSAQDQEKQLQIRDRFIKVLCLPDGVRVDYRLNTRAADGDLRLSRAAIAYRTT